MSPVSTSITSSANIKAILDYRNKARPYRLPSMSSSSINTTLTTTTVHSHRTPAITQHIFISSPPLLFYLDQNSNGLFRNSPAHHDDLLDFDKVINSQGNKTGLEL
ncbi:unnamed protein product [Absidia cylindrospora]